MSDLAWETSEAQERAKRRKNREVYYFFSDAVKSIRSFFRRGRQKAAEITKRLRPEGSRILDVGCASAGQLLSFRNGLWQLHGIESSPGLAKKVSVLCEAHGGHVIVSTALKGLPQFEPDYFDVIWMISFLEHDTFVPSILREVYKVLKPDGFALLSYLMPSAGMRTCAVLAGLVCATWTM